MPPFFRSLSLGECTNAYKDPRADPGFSCSSPPRSQPRPVDQFRLTAINMSTTTSFTVQFPYLGLSDQEAFDMPPKDYGDLRARAIEALEKADVRHPASVVETYERKRCTLFTEQH